MVPKTQFTLRSLFVLVVLIAAFLATMRVLDLEWRILLGVAGVSLGISATCLAASGRKNRILLRSMVIAVSLASVCLLWFGLYPAMYYMAGFFFGSLLWIGVLMGSISLAGTSVFRPGSGWRGMKTTEERAFLIIPLVTTLLLTFQIPLRLGAATAVPTLANLVMYREENPVVKQQQCGLYTVRLPGKHRGRTPEQIYFPFKNDGESAFVYSPTGIDDIAYNSGAKGHLFGDWYWIKED